MWPMDLIEIEEKRNLTREEAADVLRQVADQLSRHNELEFNREGRTWKIDVPKQVELEIEVEIGDDGSSLEIEINW